jgi:HPt (histidine-containing phosphotransfer) domain-containing protein
MSTLPVIDYDILSEAKEEMKDEFAVLVEYFLEDTAEYLATIAQALETGNPAKIATTAHTIKSSAKQLGAILLSDLASEMESLTRHSTDASPATSLVPKMNEAFASVKEQLQKAV